MTWADWRFYRQHSRLHWWQWIWRYFMWPGSRFHCSHSPMPQLSRERREDGSKIWYCEDCGMLYSAKDHCYRPTNRQIDYFAVAVNHAWRDVPLDLELERAARLYTEPENIYDRNEGQPQSHLGRPEERPGPQSDGDGETHRG